jgi:hypothetical protein
MARTKGDAYQVGSLVGFKLTREDLDDVIPFLNRRRHAGDEISSVLRGIVREHIQKEINPGPPQVDPDQLANWIGNLVRRAMTMEGEILPLTPAEARAVAKVAAEIDAHAGAVNLVKAKLGSKFADDDED